MYFTSSSKLPYSLNQPLINPFVTEENHGVGSAATRRNARNQDQFTFHEEDIFIQNHSLEEVERRLFGIVSPNN